jgi:hypothetical protein
MFVDAETEAAKTKRRRTEGTLFIFAFLDEV